MKKIPLVLLMLTACAPITPQQRAQAMIERLSPHCEALGYVRNTDPWRQCMQKMYAVAAKYDSQRKGYSWCERFDNGDVICR